jgi:hypothetical protein
VHWNLTPIIAALERKGYEDVVVGMDGFENQFSDQQNLEMVYMVPRASPALTSRVPPCPRACNLGRATLRLRDSPALTSGPTRARACILGRAREQVAHWDLVSKTATTETRNYYGDEVTEGGFEDRFSDQQDFVEACAVPRASPALTSRAPPCPRACNLGRATP